MKVNIKRIDPTQISFLSTDKVIGGGNDDTEVFGSFDINISFLSSMTAEAKAAFEAAEAYWESMILGYRSLLGDDASLSSLDITAEVKAIDGEYGVLGQARATEIMYDTEFMLPTTGMMQFDSADVQMKLDEGSFEALVTHEMAHVMGFSDYFWQYVGAVDGSGADSSYTGGFALAAYREEFDPNAWFIPVEESGGAGTAYSHWDEVLFANNGTEQNTELMTGWHNGPTYVSNTTIASFADIGYAVTLPQLDPSDPAEPTEPSSAFTVYDPAMQDATTLVEAMMAESSGLTIDTSSDIAFMGAAGQSSFYDGTLTELGIDAGILLTSGDGMPPQENTSKGYTDSHDSVGDVDLDTVVQAAFSGAGETYDANVLEFSFTAEEGVKGVTFDIAFGSDEYPEYIDSSYVDAAAVFVNGKNVGLFNNNETQPLSVINKNLALGNFRDNTDGHLPIEYDGISAVNTIIAPVVAGLNTVKIAIADTGDSMYDSGIFISNVSGTTTGGGGLLVPVDGTSGDDILVGGSDNELLAAGDGNDTIDPGAGDDVVQAGGGDDTIVGGNGNNNIDGGNGEDIVTYTGQQSEYAIQYLANDEITISKTTGSAALGLMALEDSAATDTLINVEYAAFADGTVSLSSPPEEPTGSLPSANPSAYYTLIGKTPNTFYMATGLESVVLGNTSGKTINIPQGASALGLKPNTIINLEGSSSGFLIERNGTVVNIRDAEDQSLISSIAASTTQTSHVSFSDGSLTIAVENGTVAIGGTMLGDGSMVDAGALSLDTMVTSSGVFTGDPELGGSPTKTAIMTLIDGASSTFTLGEGLVVKIIGDTSGKTINIPDGAGAFGLDPGTEVNVEADGSDLTFARNGTTLEITTTTGDMVASLNVSTSQTTEVVFGDGFLTIGVDSGQISLGGVSLPDGAAVNGTSVTFDPGKTSEDVFGDGAGTLVDLDAWGGTISSSATYEAGTDSLVFTDNVGATSNTDISNFGINDAIQLFGVTTSDVQVSVVDDNTSFEFTDGMGTVSQVRLLGVSDFFTDVNAFNADPNYGDISFA
ncbi:choice-of-anchor L domain-containing protein [Halomonas vilamensis]|uniref:Choice-of-anchor L domain-containing protein n=1 Tax=Vreelandella vilamensis TaxID=531309 RepID=A0ABU1H9L8_9GAMM|nr:choice-of-anchor L domain-containing protein [Halomonas vilamensis]MDR5900407.1 choice-of-anchor L domain-containing protein [Halomonas vilamensis]